eukprot:GSChrysophyteH1.ASY1.ANO1.1826.1 assembled CDS
MEIESRLSAWLADCECPSDGLVDVEGYVISFPITPNTAEDPPQILISTEREIKDFFDKYGFVVLRDVFTDEDVEATQAAMWRIVEEANPGLHRHDPASWMAYKQTGKYGLSSRGPCFDPQLVKNRQNEKLAKGLSIILGVPLWDTLVSHDRFTVYRATKLPADAYELRTGRKNVHLDLNPWWWSDASHHRDVLYGVDGLCYSSSDDFVKENNLVVSSMGPHVQCVLNFEDNQEQDGGTLVVPSSHRYLQDWCERYAKTMKKPRPFVTFNSEISEEERALEQQLLRKAIRVTMRKGSVLVWTQTLFHGTQPNASGRCRLAQFLKAFSRKGAFLDVTQKISKLPGSCPEAKTKSKSRLKKEAQRERRRLRMHTSEPAGTPAATEDAQVGTIETLERVEMAAAARGTTEENADKPETTKGTDKGTEPAEVPREARRPTDPVEKDKAFQWDGEARLARRSARLREELHASGALGIVTALGESLFGLA